MSFKTRHPALPKDEIGWFLFRCGSKWRAGYFGRLHKHINTTVDTEAAAIAWVKHTHAQFKTGLNADDIAMRFLCSAWVAA